MNAKQAVMILAISSLVTTIATAGYLALSLMPY
jgi:hypothetical protein